MENGGERSRITAEADTPVISTVDPESHIFDLYAVNPEQTIQPFTHQLKIKAKGGEIVRVKANFDDGALANAMSTSKFNEIKHRLGHYGPSSRCLRMADGSIVKPAAAWHGEMEISGVQVEGSFEVFESGGNWEFLFGKPLLTAFHAVHEYTNDTVTIENKGHTAILKNQNSLVSKTQVNPNRAGTIEKEQEDLKGSVNVLPSREVPTEPPDDNEHTVDTHLIETPHTQEAEVQRDKPQKASVEVEIDVDSLKSEGDIFTRLTDPWKAERVNEILKQVKIGPDLSEEERTKVLEFIAKWADIFALSVSEVKHVKNATHHLDIDPGTTFSTKVNQKPLTPPQRKYLYESVDAMLKADIIEQCTPEQVKCASPTTLAQKTHTGTGLTLEELQHRVNDECIAHGFQPAFSLPPRTSPTPNDDLNKSDTKWRICQNFAQINKVTKVAPMPQGDIRAKQQRLSGHRWVSGIDFASGFYAIEVDPESRPYTAFYVEGRQYFTLPHTFHADPCGVEGIHVEWREFGRNPTKFQPHSE